MLSSVSITSKACNYINIVGSSTVFPFATVVAETFGKKTGLPTPKIESTGSGSGIKLFCRGNSINTPNIVNTSRRIKSTELKQCHNNGVTDITEVLVGFDGIAFANAKKGPNFSLTTQDLYLALAAKVPASVADKTKKQNLLIDNPFTHWNQINKTLPAVKIRLLGPPSTSGTRDILQKLALEEGCQQFKLLLSIRQKNKAQYKSLCHTIREDGHYVEMGENDNLIISKLENAPHTVGIFGFSFLNQNGDKVKSASINGKQITFKNIASGQYPISRPLYFYIKNSHRNKIRGMNKFIFEFVSKQTIGNKGYLVDKGLIPVPVDKLAKFASDAKNATNLKL